MGAVDEGLPIAYPVLEKGVPVLSSDGEQVGTVHHVVADARRDIFHGIVISTRNGRRFVEAADVASLHERGVDLRNVEQVEPAISPLGHARQELKIQQGLEGDKAKEIIHAIKGQNFKVQSQLQERQIRVTGKKRDDLQAVIAFVRGRDFGVATTFKNFRD